MKLNMKKKTWKNIVQYAILIIVGIIMVYPLVWMCFAVFKTNAEIFSSAAIFPKKWVFDAFDGLGIPVGGQITLWKSMLNTYMIVIPKVVFTLISSVLTAYSFSRFRYPGRNLMCGLMVATLFLPQVVLNAPQYIMFSSWGWTDSYAPLIVPTLFAVESYFVFMLLQFLRGVPRELEEAAEIDGCNTFQTLCRVIVPMLKPSLVSCALFQFMWSSNDFQGPLIYVKTVSRYPASIFMKMSMDADAGTAWNRVLVSSIIALLPTLIVFFLAQNEFVEGISAGGVKG